MTRSDNGTATSTEHDHRLVRAGYPEGVPAVDYVPLFALLGRQLTEDEVAAIASELVSESDPESADAIRRATATVTRQQAGDAEIARVRARLAAGGWPLARVSGSG